MTTLTLEDPDEFFMSMAVFSAFVDKGMRACPEFAAVVADGARERAYVEGVASLMPLAVRLERAIIAAEASRARSFGTVERDVCEPFGAWYVRHCAANGGVADGATCRSRLAEAMVAYFAEGQTPINAWAIVRAAKAEEPSLRLRDPALRDAINWEWAPRLAVSGEIRLHEEHPLHPRATWMSRTGPVHISDYWPWVEHRVREAYVRSRYEALAKTPDVFMDLVIAERAYVEGCMLHDLCIRRDLAGQEVVESLPARTVFSTGLFSALPDLQKAALALHPAFDLDAWIGLPISDFASEYVRDADPDSTAVVSGVAGPAGEERPFVFSLTALWNAVPETKGTWRLEDGTVLKLVAPDTIDDIHEAGEALAAA